MHERASADNVREGSAIGGDDISGQDKNHRHAPAEHDESRDYQEARHPPQHGERVREGIRIPGGGELCRCDTDDRDASRRATEAIVAPLAYNSANCGQRKWSEYTGVFLDAILASEKCKRRELGPNKQMLTKTQIHGLMVNEGFDIGVTTVQKKDDAKRGGPQEVFITQS